MTEQDNTTATTDTPDTGQAKIPTPSEVIKATFEKNEPKDESPTTEGKHESNSDDDADTDAKFTQARVKEIIDERVKSIKSELKTTKSERDKYKSNYDELQERLNQISKTASSLSVENERLKLITELGLPHSLSANIVGETADELRASAENLKRVVGGLPKFSNAEAPKGELKLTDWLRERVRV
jgi:chromosome segregation ATPase